MKVFSSYGIQSLGSKPSYTVVFFFSYIPNEKDPVEISVPFLVVCGKPQSVFVGDTIADSITNKNPTSEPMDLWSVHILASNPEDSFTLSLMEPPSANSNVDSVEDFLESFYLEDRMPGEILKLWLSCKTKEMGLHTSVVYFDAGDVKIERVVFLLVEDEISHSLGSGKPFSNKRKKYKSIVDTFLGWRKFLNTKLNFIHITFPRTLEICLRARRFLIPLKEV
ncbi:putative RNA helicase SDE3 [Senna tora]|uniref:Putative RNA helicase SDE3 n=1 Tax=Senna tora TaxID=362788 RepID=A0A834THN2_9FABA|nr:putative RNA helicase SDE3 [Senna tora]